MRAAPNKLLQVGLELKLVIAGCQLFHLLIYFDGFYFKQNGPRSDYSAAWSGFIAYISMVKCTRKPLQVCSEVSFVVIKPAPAPQTTTTITPQPPSGIINIYLVDQGLKILESNVYSNIPLYYKPTGHIYTEGK